MDWGEVYNQVVRFLPRWEIVNPDELGVLVRCGKVKKTVTPGVYFCLPYFDELFTMSSVPEVVNLPHQSIRTADNKIVAITCAIIFKVIDIQKAALGVEDADEYLRSIVGDKISEFLNIHDMDEIDIYGLREYVFDPTFTSTAANTLGVELIELNVYDLAPHRIIRLMSGSNLPIDE